MSSLLYALGQVCFRKWRVVFGVWFAVLSVLGVGYLTLAKEPKDVFFIPGVEAFTAFSDLQHRFPEIAGANGQVLVEAKNGTKVSDPENKAYIQKVTKTFEDVPQTVMILDPWDPLLNPKDTVNKDETAAIINVQLNNSVEQIEHHTKEEFLKAADELDTENLDFTAGGGAWGPEPPHIGPSEMIGVVVAYFILAFTFGWRILGSWRSQLSLVSAALPLISAGAGLGIAMGLIAIATRWITVTNTAPLLAIMTGLAVGIDYSLFILARYRDELADGTEPMEASGRALATSGSAVIFAGATVTIALLGLAVTRIPFLTIMGLAAALAVITAVLSALTLLPAIFGLLGSHLTPNQNKERKAKKTAPPAQKTAKSKAAAPVPAKEPFNIFRLWVVTVTRFPIITIVAVTTGLMLLALPALSLKLALPDNGSAHEGSNQREVYERIGEAFGEGYNAQVVMTADIVQNVEPFKLIDEIKAMILKLDNVKSIPIATPNPPDGDTMVIQVTPFTGPNDEATFQLVEDLRALGPVIEEKYGIETKVTGMTGASVDIAEQLGAAVIPFGILVIGLCLVLLAVVFRSILVPIKATLTYLLSVAASFGVVTAVFQNGVLEGPLNIVYVGPVVCFLPILLMGLLFGLAMDYEVFLVSRMREEYIHGKSAKEAVRAGFVGSSKVVTAAALIMVSVFVAFHPHGDSVTQPIAFALAVGVFIDAFLVRMTLVPAIMTLMGKWAWWMPEWLDKRLPVFDVEGEGVNHQIELADWPRKNAHLGAHADRVLLNDKEGNPIYGPVSFELAPGEVTLLQGSDTQSRTALVLALAGRMKITEGKLKVAGYVVPEQMLLMRPSIALVRLTDVTDPIAAVHDALAEKSKVLLVDGIDEIPELADRDNVLNEVRAHARTAGVAALVSLSAATLESLGVHDATVRVLDITTSRVTPLGAHVKEGALA